MITDTWAIVAVALVAIISAAAVLIAGIAVKGTSGRDRVRTLHAAAALVRAIRGRN
ncbi:hypothetical protein AB0M39_13995 [Streptomyces sp. NPDC051907]|uniref:hypothetical protein n=1 Tax=Streptomyces sp. NPDC051907 TaxID=3155284 RepID=UPI003449194D